MKRIWSSQWKTKPQERICRRHRRSSMLSLSSTRRKRPRTLSCSKRRKYRTSLERSSSTHKLSDRSLQCTRSSTNKLTDSNLQCTRSSQSSNNSSSRCSRPSSRPVLFLATTATTRLWLRFLPLSQRTKRSQTGRPETMSRSRNSSSSATAKSIESTTREAMACEPWTWSMRLDSFDSWDLSPNHFFQTHLLLSLFSHFHTLILPLLKLS